MLLQTKENNKYLISYLDKGKGKVTSVYMSSGPCYALCYVRNEGAVYSNKDDAFAIGGI